MPTYQRLPRNLLALMGTSIPVQRYEALTDLCPRDACALRDGKPLSTALGDSLVVYGHRVLPPALRRGPGADRRRLGRLRRQRCGGAVGIGRGRRTGLQQRRPAGSVARLRPWSSAARRPRRLGSCSRASRSTRTPTLHFIHVVAPARPVVHHPLGHDADAADAATGTTPTTATIAAWAA